jgi:hypothetical protein
MHSLGLMLGAVVCLSAHAQPHDPKAISIFPFTGQRGTTFTATVRGNELKGATAVSAGSAPFTVSVDGVETEPAPENSKPGKAAAIDLVKLRVQVPAEAKPGRYPIRLITRSGVSNALPLLVVDAPVISEPPGSHENQDSAIAVGAVPAVYAGRLSQRGEADYYSFRAEAGQTLTFELISGLPQIASAGSAATVPNFDPSLSIYEASGSWFDAKRLKRIAFNDEPVWIFGKPTDAYLVQRFAAAGTYFLRVEAFAGQGGPDYGYELKIAPGVTPQDAETKRAGWQERAWTRSLGSGRLNQLSTRGGKAGNEKSIETYRATAEPSDFKIPATIEGVLAKPGEMHKARFHIDKPADIAIEVETPDAAPPFFNPIVRLLNPAGEEVATNIFAGRGACTGALTKSLAAKTIVPLRDTGDYLLEIRDTTADFGGADFRYRLQIRPQVPHVGEVRVEADRVNLEPGEAKTIRVSFDREEDFRGAVTVAAESLPPGVSAAAGADFDPDKDPPPAPGKRERYTPRTERVVVVLTAGADAPVSTLPQEVRFVVRPVVDGKPGEILSTKSVPMMVVAKP